MRDSPDPVLMWPFDLPRYITFTPSTASPYTIRGSCQVLFSYLQVVSEKSYCLVIVEIFYRRFSEAREQVFLCSLIFPEVRAAYCEFLFLEEIDQLERSEFCHSDPLTWLGSDSPSQRSIRLGESRQCFGAALRFWVGFIIGALQSLEGLYSAGSLLSSVLLWGHHALVWQ